MPFRFDTEEEQESIGTRNSAARSGQANGADTEIALGTRSLLAIFFGLVLVCSVFFGLGYSVGRAGGSRAIAQASPDATNAAPDSRLSKPSADQTLTPVQPPPPAGDSGAPATDDPAPHPSSTAAAQPPASSPGPAAGSPALSPSAGAQNPSQPQAAPVGPKSATLEPAAATVAGGFMVQVAAVRVPQDAQILVEALKRRGYTAVVRNEPQDQLLHVQLGPFPSRSDAVAMRARLLTDGYNAVVK